MAIFGYDTKKTGGDSAWDFIGSLFTASEDGNVTSISVAIWNYDGSAHNINVGIYADNAGAVGDHIAHGVASSVSASFNGWKTINVSASLVSGNSYWLVAECDSDNVLLWLGYQTGYRRYWDASHTFDTWGVPSGGNYYDNNVVSIYATYTPAGGGFSRAPTMFNVL